MMPRCNGVVSFNNLRDPSKPGPHTDTDINIAIPLPLLCLRDTCDNEITSNIFFYRIPSSSDLEIRLCALHIIIPVCRIVGSSIGVPCPTRHHTKKRRMLGH